MLILIDFYKCYRAYVRLKVNCFHLQEESLLTNAKSKLPRETERFLKLAYRYAVQFTRPTIWVVCGLPAGGKSTIAREVAKILGMQILQMDANIIFIECAASYEMLKSAWLTVKRLFVSLMHVYVI